MSVHFQVVGRATPKLSFVHCPQNNPESSRKNLACHGWSRCNGPDFIYIYFDQKPAIRVCTLYSMLLHLLLPRYIGPVLCGNSLARYRGKNYAKPSSESVWSRSWLSANQKTENRLGRKKYVDV